MNRQRFQESLGVLTKRLTSETSNDSDVIRQRYIENVEKLKSPLLIIASQNAPSYQAMKNTLLKTLSESSVTFQVSLLNQEARNYKTSKGDAELGGATSSSNSITIHYNKKEFETFTSSVISFLKENSTTLPIALPPVELGAPNARPKKVGEVEEAMTDLMK